MSADIQQQHLNNQHHVCGHLPHQQRITGQQSSLASLLLTSVTQHHDNHYDQYSTYSIVSAKVRKQQLFVSRHQQHGWC
jgi:hypothetical protein